MNNSIKLLVNASIDIIYEDNEIRVNTFPVGYLFEYSLLPNGNYSCWDEDSTVVGLRVISPSRISAPPQPQRSLRKM